MTEAKMPDHIWNWVEVSGPNGENRRRLPAVLFDSQEHFDAVLEKWENLRLAQGQVEAVRRVLKLLNERVKILDTAAESPGAAPYFQGRNVGELAGTKLAADALQVALEAATTYATMLHPGPP